MKTLQIEHPITSYSVWKQAFDRFAEMRRGAGVLGHRVSRPLGEPEYIVVELDFATSDEASGFAEFLRTTVWSDAESSPGLAGAPVTRLLEVEETG